MKRTPINKLSYANIEAQSRKIDWSTGYAEKWEYWQANVCDKCGKPFIAQGETRHSDADPKTECDGLAYGEGPMMNFFYPLPEFRSQPEFPGSPEDAAIALADLPLCVVRLEGDFDGEYGLALTGGGMDLSWEICEAYMRLGFLPPLHFCDLPAMAGRGASKRDQWIIGGCRESAKGTISRARRVVEKLRRLRAESKK